MSTVLSVADYNQLSNEFSVISSIDKSMGANIGAVWRDVLSLGDDTSSKVKGFLSRGENVYALVSDRYEDSFNLIEWVSQRLSFRPKVAVNALNYSLVFGKGVLPRSSEEVLSEIRSEGYLQEPLKLSQKLILLLQSVQPRYLVMTTSYFMQLVSPLRYMMKETNIP